MDTGSLPPLPNIKPSPPSPETQAWLNNVNATVGVRIALKSIIDIFDAHPEFVAWVRDSGGQTFGAPKA